MRKLAAACLVLALAVGGVSAVASADDEAICTADGGRPLRACLPSDVARSDVARSTAEVICPPGYLDEESNGADQCTAPGKGSPISAQDAWESYNRANGSTSANARSSEARADTGTRAEPTPYRTITEGQTTTFTAPVPSDRQNLPCSTDVPADAAAAKTFFASDRCLRRPNGDAEYRYFEPSSRSTVATSILLLGVCRGPYTVEVISQDARVEEPGGNRIRIATNQDGNREGLDNDGTLEVSYLLRGTRTVTHIASARTTNDTAPCDLSSSVTVRVLTARRSGIAPAIEKFTPRNDYLQSDETNLIITGEECTPRCDRERVWDTPRGCRVVVSYSGPGSFGQTNCLTANEIAAFEDTVNAAPLNKGIVVDSLPECAGDTGTGATREVPIRCVATNR
jgi:hypothetical protein